MAGIVTNVNPGPAVGLRLKANTAGMTIKPPRTADKMAKNAIQAVEETRSTFSER